MHLDRLNYYLSGGRPPGSRRTYPGCRDRRPPRQTVPVLLPGRLYFALESMAWTGGMGFYDPLDEGEMPARAYLLTASQFADIAAQEMYETPGEDLDLSAVLIAGRASLGDGRYQTLVCPGVLDGCPVLTFTAPWRSAEAPLNKPSAAYLRNLASGLRESHGWTREKIADYLAGRPGAEGEWDAADIAALLDGNGDRTGMPDRHVGGN
nr:histone deacetylase [Streptacidiphilus jeojiense]